MISGERNSESSEQAITGKTGEGSGIGYGIPEYSSEGLELNLINALEDIPPQKGGQLLRSLKRAWLFSVKKYNFSNGAMGHPGRPDEEYLIKLAKEHGARLVIFAGSEKNSFEEKEDSFLVWHHNFSERLLRLVMNSIKSGMIVAGGEGLYAEALGSSGKNTAAVLAGRYKFQYEALAESLLGEAAATYTCNADGVIPDRIKNFRFFKDDKGRFLYLKNDGEFVRFLEGMDAVVKKEEIKILKCSPKLSAIYLPFSVNTRIGIKMPECFAGRFDDVVQIFVREKKRLKNNSNWFSLIDIGAKEAEIGSD